MGELERLLSGSEKRLEQAEEVLHAQSEQLQAARAELQAVVRLASSEMSVADSALLRLHAELDEALASGAPEGLDEEVEALLARAVKRERERERGERERERKAHLHRQRELETKLAAAQEALVGWGHSWG